MHKGQSASTSIPKALQRLDLCFAHEYWKDFFLEEKDRALNLLPHTLHTFLRLCDDAISRADMLCRKISNHKANGAACRAIFTVSDLKVFTAD